MLIGIGRGRMFVRKRQFQHIRVVGDLLIPAAGERLSDCIMWQQVLGEAKSSQSLIDSHTDAISGHSRSGRVRGERLTERLSLIHI